MEALLELVMDRLQKCKEITLNPLGAEEQIRGFGAGLKSELSLKDPLQTVGGRKGRVEEVLLPSCF